MIRILISLFALSPAHAASFCQPLSRLHDNINFCDDNPNYVPPAQDCRDRYHAKVAAEKPRIEKLLHGEISTGKDAAQNLKFHTTKNVYQTTDDELTALIDLGHQTIGEVEAYADDFVPPIPPWAEGYFKPNWRDPRDEARSEDNYCYGEPMKEMDKVLLDLHQTVNELTATRAKTRQLHGVTGERDTKLAQLKNGEDTLAAKRKGVSGGDSDNEASTVTGKIKGDELASPTAVGDLAKPAAGTVGVTASGEASPDALSTVTSPEDSYAANVQGVRGAALAGREISLPSLEAAHKDKRAKSASPVAEAAEGMLEQMAKTASASSAADFAASGESQRALMEAAAGKTGDVATAFRQVASLQNQKNGEDGRNLFQRAHSAYERSLKRKRI